jgi:hypothetical protein
MDLVQLWWLSLAIFVAVVVVVAVLLGLIIAAAKSIDRHAAGIWTVGKQIAGNTVSIWMLDQTNERLRQIQESARGAAQASGAIDERLRALSSGRGR